MSNAIVEAPDLYTNPPKNAVPGARYSIRSMAVTAAQLVTTNIFSLGILPAGHRLADLFLETTDLDTGAAAVLQVGVVNNYYNKAIEASPNNYGGTNNPNVSVSGTTTTSVADTTATAVIVSGHEIITGSTIGQTGGRSGITSTINASQKIGIDYKNDRIIGVQLTTAPQTAAAGTITVGMAIDEP